jgi:transcriptional regulator of acetoin/glycerol metabolism
MWGDQGTAVLVRIHPPDVLIYADGIDKRILDMPALVTAASIAARALSKRPGAGVDSVGMNGARREELLHALNLHEWNIARVARALSVTRKTIYERMERYGIAREHVPK